VRDPTDLDFTALYEGVVTDNVDPGKLGRVRIRVPGVLEPQSGWAMPIGCGAGAGGDGQGYFMVPAIGANVVVQFKMGDVDHPRFMIGPSGRQNGESEIPQFARALTPAEVVRVRGIQSDRWELVFDDRPGHESLRVKDLQFGDVIELDGVNHGVLIRGSAAVVIQSTGVVNIEALQIVLNGRIVRDTSEEI
jgi:uncharacterized protein involved in type VI secretion and phage assembly